MCDRSLPAALTAAILALQTASIVHAQPRVIYVDDDAPDGGDGASWQSAMGDLQSALDVVNAWRIPDSDFEIRVAEGTYTPGAANGPREARFTLSVPVVASGINLSLLGSFGGRVSATPDVQDFVNTPSVLSGDLNRDDQPGFQNRTDNTYQVMYLSGLGWGRPGARIRMSGFVVRGANGLDAPESSDHTRLAGGGMCAEVNNTQEDSPVFVGMVFEDNRTRFRGGGVATSADMAECGYFNNVASSGGGASGQSGVLTNCVFEGNSAVYGGGYDTADSYGHVRLLACDFALNTATYGGGVYMEQGRLVNCLVVGNRATAVGGGVRAENCVVENCTIVDNSAAWGGAVQSTAATLRNSILFGNRADLAGDQVSTGDEGVRIEQCIVEGGPNGVFLALGGQMDPARIINADPRFVLADGPDGDPATWRDNNYRLAATSPAINLGEAPPYWELPIERDRDGLPRTAPNDLGCYEWQPRPCTTDFNGDGDNNTDTDIEAFFSALAGAPCGLCASVDFNGDGDTGTDADIEAFFRVLAGGSC